MSRTYVVTIWVLDWPEVIVKKTTSREAAVQHWTQLGKQGKKAYALNYQPNRPVWHLDAEPNLIVSALYISDPIYTWWTISLHELNMADTTVLPK